MKKKFVIGAIKNNSEEETVSMLEDLACKIKDFINDKYCTLLEKALDINQISHPNFKETKKKELSDWLSTNLITETSNVENYKIIKTYNMSHDQLLLIIAEKRYSERGIYIDLRYVITNIKTGEEIKE